MAIVTINIAGAEYRLTAEEADAAHIRELGKKLDGRAQEIKKELPKVSQETLLVMLLIILSDELEKKKTSAISSINLAAKDVDFAPLAGKIAEIAERLKNLTSKLNSSK